MDIHGNPLGFNQKGEIIIKQPHPFLGYIGEDKKTKAVLTQDGWYSTGDVGFFDEDLDFYICGRVGEYLRINGNCVSFHNELLILTQI